MKKVLLAVGLAFIGFTANAQEDTKKDDFKNWMIRLRGVGVTPDESAKIGVIGGDVNISNSFSPENIKPFLIHFKIILICISRLYIHINHNHFE